MVDISVLWALTLRGLHSPYPEAEWTQQLVVQIPEPLNSVVHGGEPVGLPIRKINWSHEVEVIHYAHLNQHGGRSTDSFLQPEQEPQAFCSLNLHGLCTQMGIHKHIYTFQTASSGSLTSMDITTRQIVYKNELEQTWVHFQRVKLATCQCFPHQLS